MLIDFSDLLSPYENSTVGTAEGKYCLLPQEPHGQQPAAQLHHVPGMIIEIMLLSLLLTFILALMQTLLDRETDKMGHLSVL